MQWICSFLMLLARWFISGVFLSAGLGKFLQYSEVSQYMAKHGMTFVPVLLVAAAFIEILGALSVILGYKTRWGATVLFFFLLVVSYLFHDFWNVELAEEQKLQTIMFFKNLSIAGGLLYVISCGPGRFSCDQMRCRLAAKQNSLEEGS